MKQEIEQIIKEWQEEIKKVKISLPSNVLSNVSNKPYWILEKKYKKRIKEIEQKNRTDIKK